jgi:hypothetical protein
MAAIDLAGTMDALALKLQTFDEMQTRVYPYPVATIAPPVVIIGYPDDIEFDMTFGRGSDRAVFPVWWIVGKIHDRTARDALSVVITGSRGVKDGLDGALTVGETTASVRVTNCRPAPVTIGDVEYLSARFDVEVIS